MSTAMTVQHNLSAMNANRMLGITTGSQAKTTEKLSSGYRINRAADDAAGLSISEKMRKQIRGLSQASTNAEDGVSAVQTAEGALTEVHSMLQRMNELATQASNGSNSESDRQSIQAEIDQLTTEIDRVSETTKFNEMYLLKGDSKKGTKTINVNAHDAGIDGILTDNGTTATFSLKSSLNDGDTISIAGTQYTIGSGEAGDVSKHAALDDVSNTTVVANTLGAKTVSAGDSIYDKSTDTTYKLVDKVTTTTTGVSNIAADTTSGVEDTFTITDINGNSTTYTYAAAGSTDLANHLADAGDAKTLMDNALAAGGTVTFHDTSTNKDYEVVDSLTTQTGGTYEISSSAVSAGTLGNANGFYAAVASAGSMTLAEGDEITINGQTTSITDKKPMAVSDITKVVNELESGDMMVINHTQNNGTTTTSKITIGDETNAAANVYTVADALSLIEDDDDVAFGITSTHQDAINAASAAGFTLGAAAAAGVDYATYATATTGIRWTNAATSVGNATSDSIETITKADALTKIANELATASSVGTDTAATVVNNNDGTFTINKGTVTIAQKLNFNLHVGADADMTNKIGVGIESMNAASLGIKNLNVVGSGDDGGVAATYAIDAIADAISKVSEQRSALGAIQNRLEHTISNLDNVIENTTSAESRIRDTDMANTMVEYSKNNILMQAGTSMLAQANSANQGILSLLG